MLEQPITKQNSNINSFCFLSVSLNEMMERWKHLACEFLRGLV